MPSPSSFFPISRMRILQLRHVRGATGIIRPFSGVKEFPLPTLDVLYNCAHSNSAHWFDRGYYPRCVQSPAGGRFLRRATQLRRTKMKTLLFMGALSLALLTAGCNNSPAAPPVPGPAGPQGQAGQTGGTGQTGDRGRTGYTGDTGQSGQTGDTGQTGDRGRTGSTGDTGQPGLTGDRGRTGHTGDTGQTGQTGDSGQTGRTGDQGAQGQAAPCPAGEHRYTDRDSGRASCVRD
jgi:hypothetical protein